MNRCEPITDEEVIKKIKDILNSKRDILLFILGINCNLFVYELISLKFNHILKKNGIIKDYFIFRNNKNTITKIYINDICKNTINDYINELDMINMNDYIFKSRKGINMHISRQRAHGIINEACEKLELIERDIHNKIVKNEISISSLRKTFRYHVYDKYIPRKILKNNFKNFEKEICIKSNLG